MGRHGESDALRPDLLILAGRLPAADSALLIKTENLLVWWFQGRLDHKRSPSKRFRMTSVAERGVGNGGKTVGRLAKAVGKHMLTQAIGTWGRPNWGLKTPKI